MSEINRNSKVIAGSRKSFSNKMNESIEKVEINTKLNFENDKIKTECDMLQKTLNHEV